MPTKCPKCGYVVWFNENRRGPCNYGPKAMQMYESKGAAQAQKPKRGVIMQSPKPYPISGIKWIPKPDTIAHCPECRKGQDWYTYPGSKCMECLRISDAPLPDRF